ncbi:hypothetical protein KIPB_010544, partial [Kipferlia bialata]
AKERVAALEELVRQEQERERAQERETYSVATPIPSVHVVPTAQLSPFPVKGVDREREEERERLRRRRRARSRGRGLRSTGPVSVGALSPETRIGLKNAASILSGALSKRTGRDGPSALARSTYSLSRSPTRVSTIPRVHRGERGMSIGTIGTMGVSDTPSFPTPLPHSLPLHQTQMVGGRGREATLPLHHTIGSGNMRVHEGETDENSVIESVSHPAEGRGGEFKRVPKPSRPRKVDGKARLSEQDRAVLSVFESRISAFLDDLSPSPALSLPPLEEGEGDGEDTSVPHLPPAPPQDRPLSIAQAQAAVARRLSRSLPCPPCDIKGPEGERDIKGPVGERESLDDKAPEREREPERGVEPETVVEEGRRESLDSVETDTELSETLCIEGAEGERETEARTSVTSSTRRPSSLSLLHTEDDSEEEGEAGREREGERVGDGSESDDAPPQSPIVGLSYPTPHMGVRPSFLTKRERERGRERERERGSGEPQSLQSHQSHQLSLSLPTADEGPLATGGIAPGNHHISADSSGDIPPPPPLPPMGGNQSQNQSQNQSMNQIQNPLRKTMQSRPSRLRL